MEEPTESTPILATTQTETDSPEAHEMNNTEQQPTTTTSRVSIEQSKMIIRLDKGVDLKVEKPNRLIASTNNLKITSDYSEFTISCENEKPGVIIIDGASNTRYFPIHLELYGVVYTKGSCTHILVGNVRKHKVANRAFPYRYCNKFMAKAETELYKDISNLEKSTIYNEDQTQSNEQKKRMLNTLIDKYSKKMNNNEGGNTVFLKSDDSLTRMVLSGGETIVLHSGRVIAWTLGISFEYKRICCIKLVSTIHAKTSGVVWIHNPYRGRAGAVAE